MRIVKRIDDREVIEHVLRCVGLWEESVAVQNLRRTSPMVLQLTLDTPSHDLVALLLEALSSTRSQRMRARTPEERFLINSSGELTPMRIATNGQSPVTTRRAATPAWRLPAPRIPVHFLPQLALRLAQYPKARRQSGVKVGSELADDACLPHELVADDLRVGGDNSFSVIFCHRSATQQTQ